MGIQSMAAMQKPRRVSNMMAMRRVAHLSWHFAASEMAAPSTYAAQGPPEESTVRRVVDIRRLRKQLPFILSTESFAAPEELKSEEVNMEKPAEAWGLVRSDQEDTCAIRTPSPVTEVNLEAAAKSRR